MLAQMIPLVLGLALMGLLFHIVPVLTRPDLFFAVTVAPEFRHTSDAARILRKYRLITWTSTLAAIALALAADIALEALLIQTVGFLYALVSAHRRTLNFAVAPNPVVEVDLAAPREGLPGGPIVALLPLVSLAVLGLWAGLHMDLLPPRFPVHWGFHGADSWAVTTPGTVLGFLAINAFTCLLLTSGAWGILHASRRISAPGAGAAAERTFRRRSVLLLIVCAYFTACPAWFALLQPPAVAITVWGVALTAVVVVFTASLIHAGQGGSRVAATAGTAPAVGDRTPDACWKWGLLYINPADPSILVEKRFGIGYTLNFGNRWSWLVMALLLAPVVAVLSFAH